MAKYVKWFLVGMALSGCAMLPTPKYRDITLSLQTDIIINDGILLPIDVIVVNDIKADSVLGVSPDEWFSNDMRERLTKEEIQKLAIPGGGTRNIEISVPREVGKIIIYADYDNNSERDGQQIVILRGKKRFQEDYSIRIQKNRLELMP